MATVYFAGAHNFSIHAINFGTITGGLTYRTITYTSSSHNTETRTTTGSHNQTTTTLLEEAPLDAIDHPSTEASEAPQELTQENANVVATRQEAPPGSSPPLSHEPAQIEEASPPRPKFKSNNPFRHMV